MAYFQLQRNEIISVTFFIYLFFKDMDVGILEPEIISRQWLVQVGLSQSSYRNHLPNQFMT